MRGIQLLILYLLTLLSELLVPTAVAEETHVFDWSVTWTTANPDGAFERRVIGINGQWPCPTIEVNLFDRIIINLYNDLRDQDTSLHFHGLFQNEIRGPGTPYMDGPVQVTQCPVGPGQRITYNFTVNQWGTYWYHSHTKGQYPDGLRGPIIVKNTHPQLQSLGVAANDYKVLTLSDWYHEEMPTLISQFLSYTNPSGAEPVPQSALMNDAQNIKFNVEPGKAYVYKIINMAAFAAQYIWFEGHTMKVIEVDGVFTEPKETEMLYITAAQRVSVVVTMKNDTSTNYPFVGSMDTDLFDEVPVGLNPNVTGWLVYDQLAPMPAPAFVDEFNPLDDFTLETVDVPAADKSLLKPNLTITLDVKMDNLGDGANYAFFNDITYVHQKVPSLYSALTTREFATNPIVYGVNANAFVLGHGDVVEIIVNNNDPGKHPFHLHGHNFQLAYRSEDDAGPFDRGLVPDEMMAQFPMIRDVVLAPPGGNIVIRFRAENPGIWLFHCHLEWHVVSGLVATLIESPLLLQSTIKIPDNHIQVCNNHGIPTSGNAAGNTKDFLDLTGANVSPDPLPPGFITRGIIALIFSTISAVGGCVVIVIYGVAESLVPGAARVVVQ